MRYRDLEVQVRAGRVTGGADVADARAARDALADPRGHPRQVRVPARVAEPVLDHDQVAVAGSVVAGEDRRAHAGGGDERAVRDREVDPGVPATALARRPEAVPDRARHRPVEAHRGRRAGHVVRARARCAGWRSSRAPPARRRPGRRRAGSARRRIAWPARRRGRCRRVSSLGARAGTAARRRPSPGRPARSRAPRAGAGPVARARAGSGGRRCRRRSGRAAC